MASCGEDRSPAGTTGTVKVFATASLTAAFTEIGEAFTASGSGVTVTFNFAGSSALVAQIAAGAPADVFASADRDNMDKLAAADELMTEPVVFTTNLAQIIVEVGNPFGVDSVEDLADPGLVVVTCAPAVPCGNYAQQVFRNAGVTVIPKSFEENVNGVVAKVVLGEADAGIVYRTDVIAAGPSATGVDIPAAINVLAEYPIALTASAPNPTGARAFVDFVLSDAGRAVLESYGFAAP
jgi:molybdate transport system substrate-binding protein